MGDRDLEAELLALFADQAERIVADLAATPGSAEANRRHRADLLHKLCGSARAVGAWGVAAGAASLERAERDPERTAADPQHRTALDDSVAVACAAIGAMQGDGRDQR